MAKVRFTMDEVGRFYDEYVALLRLCQTTGAQIDIPSFQEHPEMIGPFTRLASFHQIRFVNKVRGYFKHRSSVKRSELVPLLHEFIGAWVADELRHEDEVASRPDLYD